MSQKFWIILAMVDSSDQKWDFLEKKIEKVLTPGCTTGHIELMRVSSRRQLVDKPILPTAVNTQRHCIVHFVLKLKSDFLIGILKLFTKCGRIKIIDKRVLFWQPALQQNFKIFFFNFYNTGVVPFWPIYFRKKNRPKMYNPCIF